RPQGHGAQPTAGVTDPDAEHCRVKIVESTPQFPEVLNDQPPAVAEIGSRFQRTKLSRVGVVGQIPGGFRAEESFQVGALTVPAMAQFPAVVDGLEMDFADFVAAGVEPGAEGLDQ